MSRGLLDCSGTLSLMSDEELVGQPQTIALEWYPSKEVLQVFVESLFEEATKASGSVRTGNTGFKGVSGT